MKSLKILCVADEVDLLVYSSAIRERFGDVDLVLSAGDLPGEYLGFIATMLNKPIISVAGNHDPSDKKVKNIFSGALNLDLESGKERGDLGRLSFGIRKEAGISVLGLPGSMLYNGGDNQYSDFSMMFRILPLVPWLFLRKLFTGRGVDIILAHSPPKGIHDGEDLCHHGFKAFKWLMRFASPAYFVHGHVHVYDSRELRERQLGSTTIVNVYGHRVLTLPRRIDGEYTDK
ncbi:MAG TPA: metallophosphoesterase [Rectinemataceae bacterium]|nr:metallophosphoesterase [Rectinemataceae bacterium]